jgi:hypothetical protein
MRLTLPAGEVIRQYLDDSFDPATPVWVLHWETGHGPAERMWELPEGICFIGPPPRLLGVRLRRQAEDSYSMRLLWENTQLSWPALTRVEVLGSCLSILLRALGLDLWSMLERPLNRSRSRLRAA